MDGSDAPSVRGGSIVADEEQPAKVLLRAIDYRSSQHVLKACGEDVGWRNAGSRCAAVWTPDQHPPLSHTMGEPLRIAVQLAVPNGAPRVTEMDLRGVGPLSIQFRRDDLSLARGAATVEMVSPRPLPKRMGRLRLRIRWFAPSGEEISPNQSETTVYVTMNQPRDDEQSEYQEDGVTQKRMEQSISWVAPMGTLQPHAIVRNLMAKFPYYSLKPSSKVPRKYHHPTYFNNEGGAWPMCDYVEETGECQAIVRLVRGILRQLGVPGEARTLLVWADPEVEGGRKAITGYWDEDPSAGLSTTRVVNGKVWLAALIDGEVEEGKEYPASHTTLPDGDTSPGLNRYEACLEFKHNGTMRLYGGGAGIFRNADDVLRAFWGLVWVSGLPNDGFRVEKIVRRYR